MKKRLVSLFLALTMTWGLTACAGGSSAPASSAAPASAADPAASADAASAQGEAEGSKTDNTGTDAKASYTLNIGSAMSSTNPSSIALQSFKKAVEERTGGDLAVNKGDLLMLVCALLFSVHIMVIDFFSPVVDGVKMSCIQFFVCGAISGIGMLLYETPDMGQILAAWAPVLYAGVMSCGVAYTLQIIGQKGVNPTVASLILSLESSISVLAGWAILGQKLSAKELAGCALMFGAIILAQLPVGRKSPAVAEEG